MNINSIGLMDSGVGGLSVLKKMLEVLPDENYMYIGDTKRMPYGEKTAEQVKNYTEECVMFLNNKNIKLGIIACNTATTRCINRLRKRYPDMIFVGTEPAIKVACDKNYKNTLVMATPGTIKSERTHELVKLNKKRNQKITLLPCKGLADAIESGNKDNVNKVLHKLLDKYVNDDIDSIVLGCTHYPHAKKNIKELFPKAKLIDGNKGVSKQVKRQLESNNLLCDSTTHGKVKMIYNK